MKRLCALVLLVALVGCSGKNDPTPAIFDYAGGRYTEAQCQADVKLREFLMREIIRSHQGELDKFEADVPRLQGIWREDVIVQNALMLSAQLQAAHDGAQLNAQQRKEGQTEIAKQVSNGTCDFAKLHEAAVEAGVGAAFDRRLEQELAMIALKDVVTAGDTGFRETNVWIYLNNMTNRVCAAEEKNVELYQTASNAVRRLRAGEDFYKVFDECCNLEPADKAQARKLEEYDLNDFSVEEDAKAIWETLKAIPAGGVSEVLETADGLVIYKVFAHIDKSEQTGQFALKMGKVVVRRMVVQDIPTEEEARKIVKECFERDAMEQKLKQAVADAKIDFGACAANLSPRLKKQLEEIGVIEKGEREHEQKN